MCTYRHSKRVRERERQRLTETQRELHKSMPYA